MTTPDPNDPQKNENPGMKLRSILSAPTDDGSAPPAPLPRKELPRKSAGSAGSRPSKPQKTVKPQTPKGDRKSLIRVQRDKVAPAFVNITSAISMIINVVLLVVIFSLLRELTSLKKIEMTVVDKVLGGLHRNFVAMDQAHIATEIPVKLDNVPVNFILDYQADTVVTLTQDTPIKASVTIRSGFITINGPADIVLEAGTALPIRLDLQIPVNTTVSIDQMMAIDIPLDVTDLDKPFRGLIEVVQPYHCMLDPEAVLLQDDGTVYDLCPDEPETGTETAP